MKNYLTPEGNLKRVKEIKEASKSGVYDELDPLVLFYKSSYAEDPENQTAKR